MTVPPQVGGQLGRFKLERLLGEGSTGTVFLANDTLLNVKVALKVLNPSLRGGKAFEAIGREVLLARRVAHPGVCRIFDVHQEYENLFVTMEYIEGPTLEQFITENRLLPSKRAGTLAGNICGAVHAAHQYGIVHRGLTPRNIVVRPGDRISITDFGLANARGLSDSTGSRSPIETVHYMSPEVVAGQRATPQSDVYSVGAILYRCVTGKLPFPGLNIIEITNAVLEGRLVPPRLFNPDVAPALEKIIIKAMALNPVERYQTMAEFREWIKAAVEGAEVAEEETPDAASAMMLEDIDQGTGEDDAYDIRDSLTQEVPIRDTTILLSDIVGITPYFDKHGDMAGRRRIQKHNELLFPVIQRHRGTVIKTIGDAIMANFDNADDSVEAAMEMQLALAGFNSNTTDEESRIHIRIGLHSGQCIIEQQDVFGDAVNVASRVSSKAGADGILISFFTLQRITRNRMHATLHSKTSLKGKTDEFELYSLSWKDFDPKLSPQTAVIPEFRPAPVPAPAASRMPVAPQKKPAAAKPPTKPFDQFPPIDLSERPASQVLPKSVDVSSARPLKTSDFTLPAEDLDDEDSDVGRPEAMSKVKTVATDASYLASKVGSPSAPHPAPPSPAKRRRRLIAALLSGVIGLAVFWLLAMLVASMGRTESGNSPSTEARPVDNAEPPAGTDAGWSEPSDAGALASLPPPVQEDSLPVTKPANPESAQAALARVDRAIQQLVQKKGIIPGDSSNFDSEFHAMRTLRRAANLTEALAAGERAKAAAAAVAIDKAFVKAKLLRFNKVFDRMANSPAAGKVGDLAQDIMTAEESGDYSKANRLLNKAFGILNASR